MTSLTHALYDRFDTRELAPAHGFECWRGWCAQAVDVPMQLEPARRLPYEFAASAEALNVGPVRFVEHCSGAAVGSWTREATAGSERLRLMILAPTPDAYGSIHGQQFSLAAGAAVLVGETAGLWHSGAGLHGIQVNLPRQAVPVTDAQLASFNDQRRLLRDPIFTGLVRPALLGLSGHLGALAGAEAPELSAVWISLLTMLARSLADRDTNGTETRHARALQVRRYIQANLHDPRLSPTSIAGALYISRSTLYAALPPGSDAVAAEIRRARLARAHALLTDATDARTIADIAASVGMPNSAQFSRAFRQRYGLTPREVRAKHRASR